MVYGVFFWISWRFSSLSEGEHMQTSIAAGIVAHNPSNATLLFICFCLIWTFSLYFIHSSIIIIGRTAAVGISNTLVRRAKRIVWTITGDALFCKFICQFFGDAMYTETVPSLMPQYNLSPLLLLLACNRLSLRLLRRIFRLRSFLLSLVS